MRTPVPRPEAVRAFCSARQGLDGSLVGASARSVLDRGGWMRSVGGAGPYLGLHARAGLSREAIDGAVATLEIHELPAVRGCTYVVPASDFAIALRAGQGFGDDARVREGNKHLGVTDKELDRLCATVLDSLAAGPADPREIKERSGDAVRHLGEAGKRRGVTTTLPIALGRLQSLGEIRRVPIDGRLDQQRYRYARWSSNPLRGSPMSDAELGHALALRFFRQAAPATVDQFVWWSGLGARAARAAAAAVELQAVALPGDEAGAPRMLLPDVVDALGAQEVPRSTTPPLVSSLDNLFHARREIATSLDDSDRDRRVRAEKKEVAVNTLFDMPHHGIVDRGRLIGFWAYDFAARAIVHSTFDERARGVDQAASRTAAFIREQLGDARSFSLDTPDRRGAQLAALRR